MLSESAQVESHARFSSKSNAGFMQIMMKNISVYVFERGVGETLACGTGALCRCGQWYACGFACQ